MLTSAVRRLRKALGAVLVVLAALPALGDTGNEQGRATLFANYDVSSVSYIYGLYSRDMTVILDPLANSGIQSRIPIKTSGSSTTITAATALTAPFLNPNVGDLLILVPPVTVNNPALNVAGIRTERVIVTNADNDTVTVNAAVDLGSTGIGFSWKRFISGTAAIAGWFPVTNYKFINIVAQVTTINATSLDFTVDCKVDAVGAVANQVYTKNFTSAAYPNNTGAVALVNVAYDYCRAGWKINTDTGAQAVWTYIEFVR